MSQNHQHLIKLRGLPWTVSADDIQNFLKEVNINEGTKGIHLSISGHDGRPNGEAFVECASEDDFNRAFDYNKNVMGHRYIEVFSAKLEEFEFVMKRQNVVNHDTFVKLRGLPWNVSNEDIMDFFEGLEIRNGKEGIHLVVDNKGKSTGEAFVQFTSPEDTENALKKNREKISHRYIEIFRSSSSECRRATVFTRPPAGMDRGMNNGGNFGGNMNSGRGNFGGGGGNFGNNSRGGGGGPGRNQNNRNFRDKPYDTNWNSDGNSRPRNNFNNLMSGNDSFNNGGNNGNNDIGFNNGFNNFGGNNSNGNNGNGGGGYNSNNNSFGGGNSNSGGNRGFNSPRNNFSSSNNSNDGDFQGNGGIGGNNQNNGNGFGGNNRNSFGGNNFGNGFSNNNNGGGNMGGGMGGGRPSLMNSGNNNSGNGRNMGGGNMGGGPRNWNNDNSSDNGGKFCVHLRGMPFDCGEKEIFMFFEPLTVTHTDVQYNDNGRHTGEADAFFGSYEDAQEAMKRHKQKMGARWIELFFNNPNSRNDRQMGGGMGNQMGNRSRF